MLKDWTFSPPRGGTRPTQCESSAERGFITLNSLLENGKE